MNTLFVIIVCAFMSYLFFWPLSRREWMESMMELIWLEHMDDPDEA